MGFNDSKKQKMVFSFLKLGLLATKVKLFVKKNALLGVHGAHVAHDIHRLIHAVKKRKNRGKRSLQFSNNKDRMEEKWVNPWKPIEEIDNNSRDGERMFNKMDNYIDYQPQQRLGYLLQ